LQEKSSFF